MVVKNDVVAGARTCILSDGTVIHVPNLPEGDLLNTVNALIDVIGIFDARLARLEPAREFVTNA